MAKQIYFSENQLIEAKAEIERELAKLRTSNGVISFTKAFPNIDRKAKVVFEALAWQKMVRLVSHFGKEVAWHGFAYRDADEAKDIYYITDVVVYPQTVTGATVEMDEVTYGKWLMENDERDPRFIDIHFQGHSHVNMGVTPSSTDIEHQETILSQISKTGFYIFIIINKSGAKNLKIYDMKKNAIFENGDITVEVLDPPMPEGVVFSGLSEEEALAASECVAMMRIDKQMEGFIPEAEKLVVERKPATVVPTGFYTGYYKGGAAQKGGASCTSGAKPAAKPTKKKTEESAVSAAGYDWWEDEELDYLYGGGPRGYYGI